MNEKDISELNKLEAIKDYVKRNDKLNVLHNKGVKLIVIWNDVNEFRTLNGFKNRIQRKVYSETLSEALKLAREIIELRQKKKELVKSRNYAEAKKVSEKERKKMLGLYLFIRRGSKETFCQVGEKHLDFLQPFLDWMS